MPKTKIAKTNKLILALPLTIPAIQAKEHIAIVNNSQSICDLSFQNVKLQLTQFHIYDIILLPKILKCELVFLISEETVFSYCQFVNFTLL